MTLHVDEFGPSSAPSILFLHAAGVGGWMWQPQVDRLGEYHCLVPDLPEHGRSRAERPFSIRDAADRAADLIRTRAHGGKAHVVGLSIGGQIAVQLLSTSPDLVDRAIISGALLRPLPGASLVNLTARTYMPFRNIDFLVRANMQQMGIPMIYLDRFKEDTRLLTSDSFSRFTLENMSFRLPPNLNRVSAPTLVVVGQKERGVLHHSARDLVAALPHATGRIATKLGHAWNLQAPDVFAQTVRAWIAGEPLPAELSPLESRAA